MIAMYTIMIPENNLLGYRIPVVKAMLPVRALGLSGSLRGPERVAEGRKRTSLGEVMVAGLAPGGGGSHPGD